MAKIFLDTNYYIDIVKRDTAKATHLVSEKLYISALSTSILFYSYKIKVPLDKEIKDLQEQFGIVPLTGNILNDSLNGPTVDLEDNIQLPSAAEAGCDLFLTNDKALLKMRFFGKTEILSGPKSPK